MGAVHEAPPGRSFLTMARIVDAAAQLPPLDKAAEGLLQFFLLPSATLGSVLEESLDDALQDAIEALPLRFRGSLSFPSTVKQQWQPEALLGPVVSQGVFYTSPVRGEARAVVQRLCSIVQETFQQAHPNGGLVTVRRFNFADPRDILIPLAHVGLLVPGEGSGRSPAFVEAAFDETQLPEYVGGISGWGRSWSDWHSLEAILALFSGFRQQGAWEQTRTRIAGARLKKAWSSPEDVSPRKERL